MDSVKKVLSYLDIIRQNPDAGLDEIAEALVNTGLSSRDAEALIAFVPMGFGYVLLSSKGVTMSESFQVFDPTKERVPAAFLSINRFFKQRWRQRIRCSKIGSPRSVPTGSRLRPLNLVQRVSCVLMARISRSSS